MPATTSATATTSLILSATGFQSCPVIVRSVCGRGRGNRTPNLRFWRPTLCQLSYAPIFSGLRVYSMTLATTPAPTVLPPSRMAKRSPCSIAIGVISVTTILMLSPGITISVPLGSSTAPVTSVVRK